MPTGFQYFYILEIVVFRYGDGQYPETIHIAYPKAGTTIGKATLWVYDVESQATMPLVAPADFIAE